MICRIMGCTLAELGQRMSAKEYLLWCADYQIAPYGDVREDLRTASVVQSNIMPWSKKSIKLKDCMLNFETKKRQTPEEMQRMMTNYTRAMGGKVI